MGYTNRLTTKQQHQRERNLVAYTRHNYYLKNALIEIDEPPNAQIRCEQGNLEAQQCQAIDRTTGILDLSSCQPSLPHL